MKKLACLFLLAFSTVELRADNWLQNGDFSDGTTHWYGESKSPADYAPADPFTKPDPFTSKGMIIPLREATWRKVAQDFKGESANGILTITYMVSPDFAFSNNTDDYVNMPDKIGYDGWKAFNSQPQSWILFLSDFQANNGTIYTIHPDPAKSGVQTYRARLHNLTPFALKTVTLAFPPGTGTLVVLSVDFEDE